MKNFCRAILWNGVFCLLILTLGCRKNPPDALERSGDEEALAPAAPQAHEEGSVFENSAREAQPDGMPRDALHGAAAQDDDNVDQEAQAERTAASAASEEKVQETSRAIAWSVPKRWPIAGEESEFRVRTWRLPAVSMAGAGECALYRFPGGGDPQENLQRWMGEFRGKDGTVESVEAAQAERTIQGAPAWLVRAEGQYISQTPGDEGSKQTFDNYALFGAVIVAEGDPVFAKCVGPIEVIGQEANSILAWMDSLKVSAQ